MRIYTIIILKTNIGKCVANLQVFYDYKILSYLLLVHLIVRSTGITVTQKCKVELWDDIIINTFTYQYY